MRKVIGIFVCATLLVLLASPARGKILDAARFPYVSQIKLQDIIIVYLNQDELADALELRVCFLGRAYNYPGCSVFELFSMARPQLPQKVTLIAAFLNTRAFAWVFFYVVTIED